MSNTDSESNSAGSTPERVTQKNHPLRGHRSWLPIADYPYDEYRRRYGRDGALVEVTVSNAVRDILDLTNKIEGTID